MRKSLICIFTTISFTGTSIMADSLFHLFSDRVEGSGEIETVELQLEPFDRIQATGSFNIVVRVGIEQQVLMTIDDNLVNLINTNVQGKTLTIDTKESFSTQHGCQFEISVPGLEMVSLSGSGDIEVENLEVEFFAYKLYGSGDLKAGGEVKELELEIYGSGDIDTRKLVAEDATVDVKGSGHIKVYASEYFDAHVNGSGNIYYYGNPKHISSHISGSGRVKKR